MRIALYILCYLLTLPLSFYLWIEFTKLAVYLGQYTWP